MKKLIQIKNAKSNLLRIGYDVGNVCNYSCWYCFPEANTGTHTWPKAELVKHNFVHLINYYRRHNSEIERVEITLTGGEPSMWPDLEKFLGYVTEQTDAKFRIITNGSRTLRWWREYSHLFHHVSLSIHNQGADIQHILDLADILYERDVEFGVNVLMDPNNWDKCISIVEQLKKSKALFPLSTKPVYINGATVYTDEQHEYVSDYSKRQPPPEILEKLKQKPKLEPITFVFDDGTQEQSSNENYPILRGWNNFQGWSCNLGVGIVSINRKGEITGSCGQVLYGQQQHLNINDTDFVSKFSPDIGPVLCEQNKCWCAPEASLSKILV